MRLSPVGKATALMVFLLVFIIGISTVSLKRINEDSDNLGKIIDKLWDSTEKEDWAQAQESLVELNIAWSNIKGFWSAIIDHEEIDNIDFALSRLQALVHTKEISSCLSEASALKKYISHIPENEKLTLTNLL